MTEVNDDDTRTHIVLTKGTMVSHYRIVEKIGAGRVAHHLWWVSTFPSHAP